MAPSLQGHGSDVWWFGLLGGGAMIGAASALLLFTHGRIAGISGVVGSLLPPAASDRSWRLAFMGGLLLSGVSLRSPLRLRWAPRCVRSAW